MEDLPQHHPGADLPPNLTLLLRLSRDLRWTWRPSLRALFSSLDPELWTAVRGNPAAFLGRVSRERLEAAAADRAFLTSLYGLASELAFEDTAQPLHPGVRGMTIRNDRIEYFSAEFGLTEVLPIYAGGLGVLAGDVLKSASDLKLPLVGVGLFYREGYFRQILDSTGWQHEENPILDPDELPLALPDKQDGGPPTIVLELGDRAVQLLIRVARVGRISLFLLDADLPENHPEDRQITARLYSGDQEMRIRQEITLGIGGLRALKRLGLSPSIRHINEGYYSVVTVEAETETVDEFARVLGLADNVIRHKVVRPEAAA